MTSAMARHPASLPTPSHPTYCTPHQRTVGVVTLNAFSPVTDQSYLMSCTGEHVVTCRGGNSAVVYIY